MDITFKRIICAAALAAALLLVSAPAAHAAEYGEVGVAKTWDAGSGELPESITVRLLSGGREVSRLTLTAADASVNGSWQGSFKNVPLYNDDGTPISYTVEELTVDGFSSEVVRQPRAESVAASSWSSKVTPASQSSYSIGSSNLIAAKKGDSYYIWTDRALSAGQQSRLLTAINNARLPGARQSPQHIEHRVCLRAARHDGKRRSWASASTAARPISTLAEPAHGAFSTPVLLK